MAYFHIDRFQNYIQQELGLADVCHYSIPVDPQGFNGADNSHYLPGFDPATSQFLGTGKLSFGEGGVPDAADAMVIMHEYGHAIQDNSVPGFDNPVSGIGEGFGDFLAAVFYDDKHAKPEVTRGLMMSWDANPTDNTWPGRRYDMNWLFDGPEYTGTPENHFRGQLWCATMFELYRKLGGDSTDPGTRRAARDLTIRLHLMANKKVSQQDATVQDISQQIEAMDAQLNGWRYPNRLHQKVIYDTFCRRHVPSYPDKAVDVYIDDGRHGGYEYREVFWENEDIWNRHNPDGGATNETPCLNILNHIYVRVKNRGSATAQNVVVRGFHCKLSANLVWPESWDPLVTAELSPPGKTIDPGASVIVGPFEWRPQAGQECLLMYVSADGDRSNADPASNCPCANGPTPSDLLVRFDNNIGQRNVSVHPSDGKASTGDFS